MKNHKYVDTTDGTKRKICPVCGNLEGEKSDCIPSDGLVTHVSRNGVEVFNLWVSLGLTKGK